MGEMTFDEAVKFMMDKAAMPEPVARAEVGRYCWWPTQASSYLTGCLEILAIRDRYLAARGFATRGAARRPDRRAPRVPRRARVVGRAAAGPRRARGRRRETEVDVERVAAVRPATRTPRLVLRSPADDDLFALLEVARAGVHDPDQMPFAVAWTDLAPPDSSRSFLSFYWGCRASWTPEAWQLPLAVVLEDRPIGIQELRATGFPTLRTVGDGVVAGPRLPAPGLGTEMRAAVLALAFDGLGAEVATSGAIEGNVASRRVSEKLGYEPNGESLWRRAALPSSSTATGSA